MIKSSGHTPVLLHEVIEYLNLPTGQAGLAPGKRCIDATLDGGGHTKAIRERFPTVELMGIEYDPEECALFQKQNPELAQSIILVNDSYANLERIVRENDFYPDGVVFDLGVSSWHFQESGRGFSFLRDEPLDMRFNPMTDKRTAADIVNLSDQRDLQDILERYGEEQFAEQIAAAVVKARRSAPVVQTEELVRIIEEAVPPWYCGRKIHCATKTFQALRIAVNDELNTITAGLRAAMRALNPGGRLVVISFHGLEDKTVRTAFQDGVREGLIRWVTKDTIRPTWREVKRNPRSRSAKMKIAEKTY